MRYRLVNRAALGTPVVGEFDDLDQALATVRRVAENAGKGPATDLILGAYDRDNQMVEKLVGRRLLERAGVSWALLPWVVHGPEETEVRRLMRYESTRE